MSKGHHMAKIAFTAGRVSGFKCPPDKKQAFMWDVTAPGLGLRATPAGKPAYVFQSVYQGKDMRLTIGSPAAWSIPDAQAKARELQRLIDEGKDPRDLKREAIAAVLKSAARTGAGAADKVAAVTVGEVWAVYLEARRPHWGDAPCRPCEAGSSRWRGFQAWHPWPWCDCGRAAASADGAGAA
jgi:hypothetical protein